MVGAVAVAPRKGAARFGLVIMSVFAYMPANIAV
ncbi:hypothetical protein SAMN05216176_102285 [Nitratireductor indicus]|nr:hypothetical protein SAMN05216176_102285 [Nitratireductor indicus]